ncbi:MAG: diacylglycerol kinase family lipid kinase [Armatimonadetes bacterium]|nr:diacylglycerol kinase family lipid kinase [Armatimonadota bacterium]
MPEICVILNPAGGRGAATRTWASICHNATGIDVRQTQSPGDGIGLAREAVASGAKRVVAVGGDGTVNEVANGLFGTDTALAVVPAGTGNDWVRTVGIPSDPAEALEVALNGRLAVTDVGEAVGHRYFLNVAGVGFDAEVARCITEARGMLAKLGPTPRYLVSVLKTFFGYRGADVSATVDGEERKLDKMFLMAVAVARFYGSGMMIAPDAKTDDGLFDLVWGCDVRMHELPLLMKRIFKGAHLSHPKIDCAQCREITLRSPVPLPFHLDGDVAGHLPVTFKIHDKALKIVVP